MKLTRSLFAAALALAFGLAAQAATELPIIAKARAYLAKDTVLDGVKSLQISGTLDLGAAGADLKEPVTVEITFQKPYRQRSVIRSERGVEVTVLDGYDAWHHVVPAADKSQWSLAVLQAPQIKNLRANAFENLSFYRGLEAAGGRIEDQGSTTVDGQRCQKVAFIHDRDIVFYRYFNQSTGRLVMTETARGETIRESGTIEVSGIKFPQKLTTTARLPDGSQQTTVINFERIVVNGPIPADAFQTPSLTN
ncbi:hypothetical protein AXK11_00710 [Cephaloticoccus primus]|uniref:Outer membrane lipoprotein-sorting protein n=1 Tax=Cephaloticoccus primus TaxID=1548207 RepID=A0A139SJM8_9BACT|nr:hypothetical protein [Cephaloticoccus primus]KXU34775.1 hypothetical protein AXK11_00710 [Cephaloticoccus primus]